MRESKITRDEAFELLKKYNKDPFHIRHALTVEGVMRWYAKELGYADEEEYWGIVGLLHDIDFELYPEEHCKKAPELLKAGGVGDDMIYSICSHGYGICVDIEACSRDGKGALRGRRADRAHLVGGADAPVQERDGHGGFEPQKEVQRQKIRRGLLARCYPHGRGETRLGA